MTAEPPIQVLGAFDRERAALAAAGLPDGIAAAGMRVPDADLGVHGSPTTLHAAIANRRLCWCSIQAT